MNFFSFFNPDQYSNNLSFSIDDKDRHDCLRIDINSSEPDIFHINKLDKCNNKSGNENLKNALDFALSLRPTIKKACLYDASSINFCDSKVSIPLKFLRILSKGESWYNSLGFRSKFYSEEIEHNKQLISKNFIQEFENRGPVYFRPLYTNLCKTYNLNFTDEQQKQFVIENIYTKIQQVLGVNFERLKVLSVSDVFTAFTNYLLENKNNCTEKFYENAFLIKSLIRFFAELLKYSQNLCLNLDDLTHRNPKRPLENPFLYPNKKGGKTTKQKKRKHKKKRNTKRKKTKL